ncbi:M24 family metallopeptidase [Ciceribacter selenitireducens]|nr:Xaa-Pro peptidase family protein [Ciceribacter selenitireducens]
MNLPTSIYPERNILDRAALARLQAAGCRERRTRLSNWLVEVGLDGAVITRPQHLTYFFGLHGWRSSPASGFVGRDGFGLISVGNSLETDVYADETVRFDDSMFATTDEDRERAAIGALDIRLAKTKALGADCAEIAGRTITPIYNQILSMRRRKHPDEVALISAAIAVNEAGYRAIAPHIAPGLLETEVFALFQGAAIVAAGQTMGELGNDFRGGQPGGRPRPVPLVEGDLLPVDAGAVFANYFSDMCRTFAVSGTRAPLQEEAFSRVVHALSIAEDMIRPGVRCGTVFQEISSILNSVRDDWRFDHHLGHGLGLNPVERPFINSGSDDIFEEGCTFALEPGLYGDNLRGGIRLEQNYVIENGALRRLSNLPLDL